MSHVFFTPSVSLIKSLIPQVKRELTLDAKYTFNLHDYFKFCKHRENIDRFEDEMFTRDY